MIGFLNIMVKDTIRRKRQEDYYGVKMTETEELFVEDQGADRKMFCDTMVDRMWLKTSLRRKKREEGLKRLFEKEKEENKLREPVDVSDDQWAQMGLSDANINSGEAGDGDNDYVVDDLNNQETKKRRRTFISGCRDDDSLPVEYHHIRTGERKVREEYYRVVDKLMSKYHMSGNQATAAVVEVGNYMFNRTWKYQDTDTDTFDLDTVPDKAHNRAMGKALEAFTLAKITEKILSSDQSVTVTYHDDGSKKQGAGSYSVQGASINGQFFPFPTLNISSETRQNILRS